LLRCKFTEDNVRLIRMPRLGKNKINIIDQSKVLDIKWRVTVAVCNYWQAECPMSKDQEKAED